MVRLSQKFLIALKIGARPMYKVAHAAKLHPSMLSKLINGIEPIRKDDPRIIRVGKVVGLPAKDLFSKGE